MEEEIQKKLKVEKIEKDDAKDVTIRQSSWYDK